MKDKFWEFIFFIERYPRGFYILICGLAGFGMYVLFGAHMVSELEFKSVSPQLHDAFRSIVISAYQEKSLALLAVVLIASYRQFIKDKKRFDRWG